MRIRTCDGGVPIRLWRKCADVLASVPGSWPDLPIPEATRARADRAAVRASGSVVEAAPAVRRRVARDLVVRPRRRRAATAHGLVLRRDPGRVRRRVRPVDRVPRCSRRPRPPASPVPRVRVLLEPDDDLGRGLRHGPRRGRDHPPPDPPRRRVRAAPDLASPRSAARSRRASTRSTPRRCRALPVHGRRRADRPVPRAARHLRRAAPRVRARAALARRARAAARRPARARARRLPQRQLHRRPRRHPRRARLGARAPRRSRSRISVGCA